MTQNLVRFLLFFLLGTVISLTVLYLFGYLSFVTGLIDIILTAFTGWGYTKLMELEEKAKQ
ncbi:hypothetical protein MUN88_20370 [Gracilibacillus caseinilyticus]|uniref:Uncharacterized protein n=1 Tax=Gracilibacillus caseinilyticus TaxID=2932256 RepID=A0ABY4EWF5_9BACI|nr:hypothetical protein [Gracilibacillus caseinilyticus]UOQ48361.1 hypothetical protein MUN88_20370 [Gracilibacillus caseinilyticus]